MFKLTVELPNKLAALHFIDKNGNSIQEKQATQVWTLEAPDCEVTFTKLRISLDSKDICEFSINTQSDMHLKCLETDTSTPP